MPGVPEIPFSDVGEFFLTYNVIDVETSQARTGLDLEFWMSTEGGPWQHMQRWSVHEIPEKPGTYRVRIPIRHIPGMWGHFTMQCANQNLTVEGFGIWFWLAVADNYGKGWAAEVSRVPVSEAPPGCPGDNVGEPPKSSVPLGEGAKEVYVWRNRNVLF